MSAHNWFSRLGASALFIAGMCAGLALLATPGGRTLLAPATAQAQDAVVAGAVTAAANVLSYQGLLLDPSTGTPKADGVYEIAFRLYNVETDGAPLWAEAKDLATKGGRFSTLLGSVTPLDLAHFDGQELWLAVKVGTDAEATPRQRIAFTAYAFYARNADNVDGLSATAFVRNDAGQVDNNDVPDGALAPAKIDGTAWTTANDGAGSGLDADLLDGQQAAEFAAAGHNHDADYVNAGGDSMSGDLTVPRIVYSTPRTHYFSISSEAFVPGSNVGYYNSYGQGGAYIREAISGAMVAQVNLPHGATVTGYTVYYRDNAANDMSVTFYRQSLTQGFYSSVTSVTTSGQSTDWRSVSAASFGAPIIDNLSWGYLIYAFANPWDVAGELEIKGVVIAYTLSEAP